MLADIHAPKKAPHPLRMFHPWLAGEPAKRKAYKPADLRAEVAKQFYARGQVPPWERTS